MSKPLLIIDSGHGGSDPGGGSNEHWLEKDLNLKISLYQYDRFKKLGIPIQLTRHNDLSLPHNQRSQLVKDSGATYCLSNHINAGGGQGAELIHSIYSTKELPTSIAKELEKHINMRRIFTRTLISNPSKDYYYMHRDTGAVETIIVEYGFADNYIDTDTLRHQWLDLAEAVVKGFCNFANYDYQPPIGDDINDSWLWAKEIELITSEQQETVVTMKDLVEILHKMNY
ncbi:N-acetylmuramoyl-L-alanine amidase family protein [Vallitalea okinawensis]|uniref:N-acetylmuramoyl-L-alanine amidase family protein n=1 Tax=Vallitalea okinawensis TaxID=2078660 RepID=UPI000CFA9091|nr:N-acetylmuramoyl-L-alanine amidase [Vallitalea okinawensis]